MNNNTVVNNNNYASLQYYIFSSKFPRARERIASTFVDNLGTRHQKRFASPPVYTIYTSFVSPGPVQRILLYLPRHFLQRQLDIWTAVRLTVAKFKPLIFPMLGFALSNVANIFIVIISYTSAFCLYNYVIRTRVPNFESHMHLAVR